jgi:hypothetical protein
MRSVCRFRTDLYFGNLYGFFWLLAEGRSRPIMPPLWIRHTERQISYLAWKLAWLSVFLVAKRSLIYWTNELK